MAKIEKEEVWEDEQGRCNRLVWVGGEVIPFAGADPLKHPERLEEDDHGYMSLPAESLCYVVKGWKRREDLE